jgi:uncharacterized membrane protein YkvA (DUF1232 family)
VPRRPTSRKSNDHPEEREKTGRTGLAAAGKPVIARFSIVLFRVPRYLKLSYRMVRDGRLTARQRAVAAAGAAYTISPLDPLPGFIPVVGQLDDLAVLLLSLRQALRSCPPEIAEEHLRRAGLTFATLDADLATIRATAIWVAQQAARGAGRLGLGLARLGRRRAGALLDRLRRSGHPRDGQAGGSVETSPQAVIQPADRKR